MIVKIGLIVCGLMLAGYCGYAAFEYSLGVGANPVFAGTMSALTAGNVMLAAAAGRLWRDGNRWAAALCGIAWSIILTVLLANSAGFTVGNRQTVAVDKDTEIASHARAQQQYDDVVSALAQAHKDSLWSDSSACADAGRKVQRVFCARVSQLEADKARLDADLRRAPPASADVQADWLAEMLGRSSKETGPAASIATAVVLEVAANIMLLVGEILRWPAWMVRRPAREAQPARVEPASEAPAKRRRRGKKKKVLEPRRARRQDSVPPQALRLIPGDKL
jgi:hypothetical protein